MTLYRETPCEHGYMEEHYTCDHIGYPEYNQIRHADELCHCPGGSRTEVTIDYDAALIPFLREHKRYHNIYDGEHPDYPLDLIRVAVVAALGITEANHKHDWIESILGDGQVCQVGDCGAFIPSDTEDTSPPRVTKAAREAIPTV